MVSLTSVCLCCGLRKKRHYALNKDQSLHPVGSVRRKCRILTETASVLLTKSVEPFERDIRLISNGSAKLYENIMRLDVYVDIMVLLIFVFFS